jgi:hypothetical protein
MMMNLTLGMAPVEPTTPTKGANLDQARLKAAVTHTGEQPHKQPERRKPSVKAMSVSEETVVNENVRNTEVYAGDIPHKVDIDV